MTSEKIEKRESAAPQGAPVNAQELDQLTKLYNGFNLFHKGQMLTFLSKDVLIQSPEGEAFLPMSQCEIGIAGTTIVMKLPGSVAAASPDSGEPTPDAPTKRETSREDDGSDGN